MPDELADHPLREPQPVRRTQAAALAPAVVALVLGAGLLFAGYWGVSDTANPGDQIPYLASSTVPGLALVSAGIALLLRHEHRLDREELHRLRTAFDALVDWLADAGAPPDSPVNGPRSASAPERTA